MQFKLTFDMDNAAFDGDPAAEVKRALRDVVAHLDLDAGGMIYDVNGNSIGHYATWGERPSDAETVAAYLVCDRDGDALERHENEADALRSAEALNADELADLSETDRALARQNDMPYHVAAEYADGTVSKTY